MVIVIAPNHWVDSLGNFVPNHLEAFVHHPFLDNIMVKIVLAFSSSPSGETLLLLLLIFKEMPPRWGLFSANIIFLPKFRLYEA